MYKYLIYSQIKSNAKADKAFHMPGHKARGDFKTRFPIAHLDVTELSYSDNLMCPKGVIAEAQKDIAEILGAQKSYILTDGSTSGVLAMTYVASKYGTKIIVPRNCHVSVWNACKLFGLEPVIVQGEVKDGVLQPPEPELIENLILNDRTIGGMIVTSPDYYGTIAPLKEYSEILRSNKRVFLVDGAHGAHLAFEPERKGYAGVYADIWVDGVHKSMPALTQGAVVSVNNKYFISRLEEGVSMFRTTSPSYPIMASVEYAIKYVANNPKVLEDAKAHVAAFREKCPVPLYPSDDWTKVAADFEGLGISSRRAAEFLEKKGIYAEFSDGKYLMFYLSPQTVSADLSSLSSALNSVVNNKKLKNTFVKNPPLPVNDRTYSFQYALKQKRELVPLKDAVGRMCAKSCGIVPPCFPVVAEGEIVTANAVRLLSQAENVYGLEDGKIWTVKK